MNDIPAHVLKQPRFTIPDDYHPAGTEATNSPKSEHQGFSKDSSRFLQSFTKDSPKILQSPRTQGPGRVCLVDAFWTAFDEVGGSSEQNPVFHVARAMRLHPELRDYPHREIEQAVAHLISELETHGQLEDAIDELACEDEEDLREELASAMQGVRYFGEDPIVSAHRRAMIERIELQKTNGTPYPRSVQQIYMLSAMLQIAVGAKPIALPQAKVGQTLWPNKLPDAARQKAGRFIREALRQPGSPLIQTRRAHAGAGIASEYLFDLRAFSSLESQAPGVATTVGKLIASRNNRCSTP